MKDTAMFDLCVFGNDTDAPDRIAEMAPTTLEFDSTGAQ